MMTNNSSTVSALLLMLVTLFIILINSPTTAFAAKGGASGAGSPAPAAVEEPYKVVDEFCHQRSSKADQEFCLKALKSDPRSATAKDNATLLSISDDLAVENTNQTRGYLKTLSKRGDEPKQPPLIKALKECISTYDVAIMELKILPQDFQDDPSLASYDALQASDALSVCRDSLNRNNITDHRISERLKISIAYVLLCLDIANKF